MFGNEEVGLGKAVGKAGSVGCCNGDKKQTLHELACFTQCGKGETEESRQVKGRALVCGALFGQENKEVMADLIECFQNDIQLGTTTLRQTHSMQHFEVSPIVALFQRSSDMNDVYGTAHLCCCYQKGDGVPRDNKNALLLFQRAVDNGGALSLFQRGLRDTDFSLAQGKVKWLELIQQAAEMSDADAMVNLYHHYMYGPGTEKDRKKAIELILQAADMGNTDAMLKLGECYEKGDSVPQDVEKAIELYEQAAEMGDCRPLFDLSVRYMEGDGIPQDNEKAIDLLQRLVDLNYTKVMIKLGDCYLKGDGVTPDKKKAIELYQRAADLDDNDAVVRLTFCSEDGDSVKKDENKATNLFQEVATIDWGDTMYHIATHSSALQDKLKTAKLDQSLADDDEINRIVKLGEWYEKGICVPQNVDKAIELYQQAAEMGRTQPFFYLVNHLLKGDGVPQDTEKAIRLYQQLVGMDYTGAMAQLGDWYMKGDGVTQDKKKAIELYQQAARTGNVKAMTKLCVWYAEGDFDTQDKVNAIQWFQQAVDLYNAHILYQYISCDDDDDEVQQVKEQFIKLLLQADEMGETDNITKLFIHLFDGINSVREKKRIIEPIWQTGIVRETYSFVHLAISLMKERSAGRGINFTKLFQQVITVERYTEHIIFDVFRENIHIDHNDPQAFQKSSKLDNQLCCIVYTLARFMVEQLKKEQH